MCHSRFLLLFLATIFTLFGIVSSAPVPAPNSPILRGRAAKIRFTANPKEWPTRAQLEVAMRTPPNKAFFWSGQVGTRSVEDQTLEIAKAAGGVTLELALSRAGLSMPHFTAADPASEGKWEEASKLFAALASGQVFAVQGVLRPGNVFIKDELPALKANKNVKAVIKIDAATKVKSTIFSRP